MKLQISDFRFQIASRWPIGVLVLALLAGGCAAGTAYRQGESLMRAGSLDEAVAAYRKAAQAAPDNATYRISLQRAMQAASRAHLEKAREFEKEDQLAASAIQSGERIRAEQPDRVGESRRADRRSASASRRRGLPAIQGMRERARRRPPGHSQPGVA